MSPKTSKGSAAFAAEMAAIKAEKRAAWDLGRLERVRRICMEYPGVVEVEQFGEPWWKVGKKPFASYGAENVRDGMAFNVTLMDQSQLLEDPRFERTHYIGQHGWTTMVFGKKVDWAEVEELVDIAYRKVAPKRLTATLDLRPPEERATVDTVARR
ncbi:MAG: MmcQ/YjbR family DNA-binding protein [bacterium]